MTNAANEPSAAEREWHVAELPEKWRDEWRRTRGSRGIVLPDANMCAAKLESAYARELSMQRAKAVDDPERERLHETIQALTEVIKENPADFSIDRSERDALRSELAVLRRERDGWQEERLSLNAQVEKLSGQLGKATSEAEQLRSENVYLAQRVAVTAHNKDALEGRLTNELAELQREAERLRNQGEELRQQLLDTGARDDDVRTMLGAERDKWKACAEKAEAERDELRKTAGELARAAVSPEPGTVEALEHAYHLVTGEDIHQFGGNRVDDLRDILWQKLCHDPKSSKSLRQCVRLLTGNYPKVTVDDATVDVTACASVGTGRAICMKDRYEYDALQRLIATLAGRAPW